MLLFVGGRRKHIPGISYKNKNKENVNNNVEEAEGHGERHQVLV